MSKTKTQTQIRSELKQAWAGLKAAQEEVSTHNENCRNSSERITFSKTSYCVAMWALIAHLTSSLPMKAGEKRAADVLAAGGTYRSRSYYCGAARVYPSNDPQHKGYALRESTVTDLYLRGII